MKTNKPTDLDKFRNYLTCKVTLPEADRVCFAYTIKESWMQASFENAYKSVTKNPIVVDGFRPGKAPKNLTEEIANTQALQLCHEWLVSDLVKVSASDSPYLLLGDFDCELDYWEGSGDFSISLFCLAWVPLKLDLSCLNNTDPDADILLEKLISVHQKDISQNVLNFILTKNKKNELGTEEEQKIKVMAGLILDSLASHYKVSVTEDDINKSLAELAVENNLSLLEINEQLKNNGGRKSIEQTVRGNMAIEKLMSQLSAGTK